MKRFFLEIAYNGANYHGWQIQDNAITVQEELIKAVEIILQAKIKITGCGRTDTGVHATQFFAHFDANAIPNNFVYSLNGLLPKDIAVKRVISVDDDAHARFGAVARTYKYYVRLTKDPFNGDQSYFFPKPIDLEVINEAAKKLFDYTDFTSFSKLHSDTHTNNCVIKKAEWFMLEDGRYVFEISADRFLRNMVRAIVGTLLDVGKGKHSVNEFCKIIESKDRGEAGKSVDGKALFLTEITYPFIDKKND